MKAPRTPVFKVGIHRVQRFMHGAWRTLMEAGWSCLSWVRSELDEAGRAAQLLLALVDSSFETLQVWRDLPERTVLAARTARRRHLYYLPKRERPGRPASYGSLAPHPWEWLRGCLKGWAHEIHDMSLVMREVLFVELPAVETENK